MLGVIVYRVAVTVSLARSQDFEISWISLFASFTAAVVNLLCIMLLNKVSVTNVLPSLPCATHIHQAGISFLCLYYSIELTDF